MALSAFFQTAYDYLAQRLVRSMSRSAQRPYIRYCFSAMGRISKSCGRVTEAHIGYAEQLINDLRFDRTDRRNAIDWFREGRSGSADFHRLANACNKKPQPALAELVLECMVHTAHIEASTAANRTLKLLSSLLRVDNDTLVKKQSQILQAETAVQQAYRTLDVEPNASIKEIKSAYRTLASRYHPDKLGLNPEPSELAHSEARSVEIRAAYDLLLEHHS